MQRRIIIHSIPFSWPERILASLFAVLLVLVGLTFGALVLGLSLVSGLGLAARIWWPRRRLRREGSLRYRPAVVEGEYQVLERHSTRPSAGGPS